LSYLSKVPLGSNNNTLSAGSQTPSSTNHISTHYTIFSVMLLRPYNMDSIAKHIQHDPHPPIVHDGVEEYKVEQILDS